MSQSNTIKKIWLIISVTLMMIFVLDSLGAAFQLSQLDAEKVEVGVGGEVELKNNLEKDLIVSLPIASICKQLEAASKISFKAHFEDRFSHQEPEKLYLIYHQLRTHIS